MVHELTSEKTADEIEAGGLELHITRTPGQEVNAGDGCVITSADECVFIGTVLTTEPRDLSVWVRLS
ncbi:hypothetical protein ACIQUY_29365 [Streptomyces sp. NPDC090231]|uniref:hypothetical protein n=1 Tax=unclassified Streptomyces TaxID=2593676 RepID=UPI003817F466